MKTDFKGFYRPNQKEFEQLWNECLFVFDTNVLLDLYRYPQNSRETILGIIEQIKARIWIPHQVGLEYHFHMIDEITKQNKAYSDLDTYFDERSKEIESVIEKYSRHVNLKVTPILKDVKDAFEKIKSNLIQQKETHPDLSKVQDKICDLFSGKMGQPYEKEKLDELYKLGEERYSLEVPPGFEDGKGKGEKNSTKYHDGVLYQDKYGDLILWFQIIEKAKKDKKSVILVTAEKKEDWWKKHKGETVGPHPELIHEFYRKTDGQFFYLYKAEKFIKYANDFLNLSEPKDNIDLAVKGIEEFQNEQYLLESLSSDSNIDINEFYDSILTNLFSVKNETGSIISDRLSLNSIDLSRTALTFLVRYKDGQDVDLIIRDLKVRLSELYPNKIVKVRRKYLGKNLIIVRILIPSQNIDKNVLLRRLRLVPTKLDIAYDIVSISEAKWDTI